jgi:hypothetical protein
MTSGFGTLLAVFVAVAGAGAAARLQEKATPAGSTRLTVTGCLKGRVLRATQPREPEVAGPNVAGRSFRLAAPKAVMADIKRSDGGLVEIIGLVKSSDFAPPGIELGRTRVVIGAPPLSADPTRNPARDPLGQVVVMDVLSLRRLRDTCPLDTR